MIKYTFAIILIALATFIMQGQINFSSDLKKFDYYCISDTNSILLPNDFSGPKYFYYEEGAIVNFIAPDLSGVAILCGACADLSCGDTYAITDTLKNESGWYSICYFDKLNNVYSRKLRAKNRTYMYSNVPTMRKAELDFVFDLIEKVK